MKAKILRKAQTNHQVFGKQTSLSKKIQVVSLIKPGKYHSVFYEYYSYQFSVTIIEFVEFMLNLLYIPGYTRFRYTLFAADHGNSQDQNTSEIMLGI